MKVWKVGRGSFSCSETLTFFWRCLHVVDASPTSHIVRVFCVMCRSETLDWLSTTANAKCLFAYLAIVAKLARDEVLLLHVGQSPLVPKVFPTSLSVFSLSWDHGHSWDSSVRQTDSRGRMPRGSGRSLVRFHVEPSSCLELQVRPIRSKNIATTHADVNTDLFSSAVAYFIV